MCFPFQGMAFSLKERQVLGLHGLLPPALLDQQHQVERVMVNFHRWENDLDRYIYLISLQDRNEKLFYKVVTSHIDIMLPIIYTPTVGLACQKYGLIFRKPRYKQMLIFTCNLGQLLFIITFVQLFYFPSEYVDRHCYCGKVENSFHISC